MIVSIFRLNIVLLPNCEHTLPGFDGQQGKDPNTGCSDSDKCKTIWDANGHRPSVRQEVWEYVVYRYIEVRMFVRGLKNGIRGGRGGDGGVGGNGGEPGQAKFIGLKSSPQISTIKEKGIENTFNHSYCQVTKLGIIWFCNREN